MGELEELRKRIEALENARDEINSQLEQLENEIAPLERVETEAALNAVGLSLDKTYRIREGYAEWYSQYAPNSSLGFLSTYTYKPQFVTSRGLIRLKGYDANYKYACVVGDAPVHLLVELAANEPTES